MFERVLAVLFAFTLFTGLCAAQDDPAKKDTAAGVAQIAHIRLAGALDEAPVAHDALFGSSAENFKTKLEHIRKAKADKNIQGLVIHLDGLQIGFAKMEELRKAIEDFRKSGKKVFTYLEAGDAKDYRDRKS